MSNINNDYYVGFTKSAITDKAHTVQPNSEYEDHLIMERREIHPRRPLRFMVSGYEENNPQPRVEPYQDVYQYASSLIVSTKLSDVLFKEQADNLQLVSSVLIDIDHEWHEDFSYVNIFEDIDCLDLLKSNYKEKGSLENDNLRRMVTQYSLDSAVLNELPLKSRLLFSIGSKVRIHDLFFHKKVVNALRNSQAKGYRFFEVQEYERGMEYWDQQALMESGINVVDLD